MADLKLLSTYLNDHLAGATVGTQLARRSAGNNEGSDLGTALRRLAGEIDADRETLMAIMERLGVNKDRLKIGAGWLGEKAGRLKPNNSLFSYSPLSRLIELEGLALGVEGKRGLWQVLAEIDEPRLAEFDFDELLARASSQRDQLEEHRLAAGLDAFHR